MPNPPIPDPASTALFLDIDGTLVDHCPHPEGVVVAPDLCCVLADLRARLDGAIAFVTGRDLAMVDRLFGDLSLAAAGTFGLERRITADDLVSGAEEAAVAAPVFAWLERRFAAVEGVHFERKGAVLAIHTRAAPDALGDVTDAGRAALKSLPEGYRLVAGHAGVELLPEGATKSAAIAWFMARRPFRDRVPVFLGDDTSDESGFDWVNGRDGVSIRVRPEGSTGARHTLATVADVHRWLKALSGAGAARGTTPRRHLRGGGAPEG